MEKSTGRRTVKFAVRLPGDHYDALVKIAATEKKSVSEIIRQYIDRGISIKSYEDDADTIARVVRLEVKAQLDRQIDRLAKMNMKIGKITGGGFYLLIKLLLTHGLSNAATVSELAIEAQKLGVRYMQMKDADVNVYLEDEEMSITDAMRL
jgi:predicted DNA-binding ribbon-helix-helix protein